MRSPRERRLIEARISAVQNRPWVILRLDRFKAWINSTPGSIRRVTAVVAPLVLFFVLRHRDRIAADQPAVQIDIGAPFRAKRLGPLISGLAADRAGFALFDVRHSRNMGCARGLAKLTPR